MKRVMLSLFVGLVGLALAVGGILQPAARPARAATHVVDIPGDRFEPFAMTVKVGDTVTWQNDDTDLHTIVSVPSAAPVPINLTVRSGKSADFTFTVPGLYVYYCNVHAKIDPETTQVAGGEADDPSEPMEGAIMVIGPNSGAASSATITATSEDLFSPFAVSVTQGSTVTWQNSDDSASHTVTKILTAAAGLDFDGLMNPGDSASVRMTAPGLYWYYSRTDASYDADNGQVSANDDAAHPDQPMMGLIAVFPPIAAGGVGASSTSGSAASVSANGSAPATVTAPRTGTGIAPPNTGDAGLVGSSSSTNWTLYIGGAFALALAGLATFKFARR